MLTIDNLYGLFKPVNNENKITAYPLIIGGGGGSLDMVQGGWILSPLRSYPLSKSTYSGFTTTETSGILNSALSSIIRTDYQLDFYIKPKTKATALAYFDEGERMREYLKSIDAIMYLRKLNAEIIPALKEVRYFSEYGEQKLLYNRAILEFSIVSESSYNQEFYEVDRAEIIGEYVAHDGKVTYKNLKEN